MTRLGQRDQGRHGAGLAHAVLELEELRRPLDVGQRPAAELEMELRVLARRDALALDARLHATNLADLVDGERPPPDEAVGDLHEPRADAGVTGDDPCARERLSL